VHRFLVRLMAAASVLALAVVLSPGVAAAAVAPTVYSVDNGGDPAYLRVSASSDTDVTTLRATLFDQAGTQVGAVDHFLLVSGTAADGMWTSAERMPLTEIGIYRVDVEAVDADGDRTDRSGAGYLSFKATTSFGPVTLNRSWVDYTRRTVTVRGSLFGRHPATGVVTPVVGRTIEVASPFATFTNAVTRADGTFVATVPVSEAGRVWAQFWSDGTYFGATTGDLPVTVNPAPTRIAVTADRHKVDLGESITLSARLTWRSPDGWQPLADKRVGLQFCQSEDYCPGFVDGVPRTDADGWTHIVVQPYDTGYYQFAYGAMTRDGQLDPFVAEARGRTTVTVVQPASFTAFHAERDGVGNVVVGGLLEFDHSSPGNPLVHIQFKPAGSTEWTTVSVLDNVFGNFDTTIDQPAPGHWRAVFQGIPNQFQRAVSEVVYLP
jgi:hypothetical protein